MLGNRFDDPLHAGAQVGGVSDDAADVFEESQSTMPARLTYGDGSLFRGFSHEGKRASLLRLYIRRRPATMRRPQYLTTDETPVTARRGRQCWRS